MAHRPPVVAGQFYPASENQCRKEVAEYLAASPASPEEQAWIAESTPMAGIVPHAGWVCSGAVAAQVIRAVAQSEAIETVVVFGAVHLMAGPRAAVYAAGYWQTPLGETAIDEELACSVIAASPIVVEDHSAHNAEHSIEVQLPFVQYVAPSARLLPIMVPPSPTAHQVGQVVAEQARSLGRKAVFLGSTDLTHYGPRYRFTPQGEGPDALKWAKDVNDRRIIDLCLRLSAEEIVAEAGRHHNACGGGAIAATLGAARTCGATRVWLCRHTTSAEVLRDRLGKMADAVGYTGILFAPEP